MTIRKRTATAAVTFILAAGSGAALAADGAAVFKAQCAKCHGETGQADSPAAKAMKAPAIAGDAKIAGLSEADLAAKIKENKKHVTLKSLTDADLAAVATYAKQLAAGK